MGTIPRHSVLLRAGPWSWLPLTDPAGRATLPLRPTNWAPCAGGIIEHVQLAVDRGLPFDQARPLPAYSSTEGCPTSQCPLLAAPGSVLASKKC